MAFHISDCDVSGKSNEQTYKMPPLDWERIMGTDAAALEEDPDAADDMYTVLESVGFLFVVVAQNFDLKLS